MVFHIGKATSVYFKTMPFVLLRLLVGALLGVFAIVYFGVIGFVAFRLLDAEAVSTWIAVIGLIIALGLFVGILRLVSRYVLYLVKAAHIAVIAHIVETGTVPENQLSFGKNAVKERFAEASGLFALDQLVKAVLKQFNNGIFSPGRLLPTTGAIGQLIRMAKRAIAIAVSYIDEAILAYIFISDETNSWRAARDGLVLYAKQWKPVLATTMAIVIAMYLVTIAALLALTPLASVLGGLAPTYEALGWVIVVALALVFYTGFLKPWVKTVVITTFLIEQRDSTPDSETLDSIANRSDRFSELLAKADEADAADEDRKTPATA
ncbi:hypothetical protein [Halovivax gelatinilyticus]|uniref:hypothetical protein n=1 Tax=Halovivax gelatinilyticus TaxID=2961597 RepID=UPI0020CA5D9D|nr:hypothetical protein [Halovivax gelatinilyticus]